MRAAGSRSMAGQAARHEPDLLDVLTFPCWGSRLIEASAGTGKTWTIAALYLRLVLGHAVPDDADNGGDARCGACAVARSW